MIIIKLISIKTIHVFEHEEKPSQVSTMILLNLIVTLEHTVKFYPYTKYIMNSYFIQTTYVTCDKTLATFTEYL